MALTAPRTLYGIHSVTFYNRADGLPYGPQLRVLGSVSLSQTGELVKLIGGSSPFPWDVEDGAMSMEVSMTVREFPNFLWEVLMGKAPTDNAAEASASVTTITNKKGTSTVSATVGIASVAITTAADVKFASYIVKVISATTVDVFEYSDVDNVRGTDLVVQTDLMKITASVLTVPGTSGTVAIPNTAITITGGSGSIAMTANDTATFSTRAANTDSMDVEVGALTDNPPEFGCFIVSQQRGNGEMFEIDLHRCRGIGFPLNFSEGAFNESEIKFEAFYDNTLEKVYTVRHVVI